MNTAIKTIIIMCAGVVGYKCGMAAIHGIKEIQRKRSMPKWMKESEKRSPVDYSPDVDNTL